MKKQKILYLMEYPLDLPGGAQLSTFQICDALMRHPEAGYVPVVVCPRLLKQKARDYSFRVRTYPMGERRLPNLLKRIKAFQAIIREEKPRLIHIEMSESLITYGFIRRLFPRIPYIYTDRGMYFGYRKRSQLFMFPVLRGSRMLVTTTDRNASLWEKNTDIRPISVIPNTVSDVFESYDEGRKKRGGVFKLGFAGRICVEKDWPYVPVLVKTLWDAGLRFQVGLVLSLFEKGDREKADKLVTDLREIVGEDNLDYREDLTQEEISDFYYGLDLFIMTSQFESFGKAAVEAMSRKCALLSTAVGGLPEVIGRRENLYSKNYPGKAVSYVRSIMTDPDRLSREQEYFYNRFRDNYTQDAYLRRHLEVYDRILN
ncbi:MAG: glycosyltransferase family 4 protein [Lachnospiraceae bacterium]|nr:glycosyltransferase family 4 protein [Lachnospiraceae bacterium]